MDERDGSSSSGAPPHTHRKLAPPAACHGCFGLWSIATKVRLFYLNFSSCFNNENDLSMLLIFAAAAAALGSMAPVPLMKNYLAGGSFRKSDDDIIPSATDSAGAGAGAGVSRLFVGHPRPLNRALFGVNCGVESDFTSEPILYSNTSLIAAIRALGIGAMRYPGGTPANFFDWRRGSASSYLEQSDVAQRLEDAGLAVNCSAFKDCSENCSCYSVCAKDISRLPLGTFSPGNFAALLAKADVPTVV